MKQTLYMLIIAGLIACQPRSGKDQTPDSPEQNKQFLTENELSDDEKLYRQHCGTCHQYDGSGVPGMYPPLKDNPTVTGNREELITMVLAGISGPIEEKNEIYSGEMPPQDYLTDEEISKILSFVKAEFNDSHDPVMVFEVKAVRIMLNP